jgi:hypothetical protein
VATYFRICQIIVTVNCYKICLCQSSDIYLSFSLQAFIPTQGGPCGISTGQNGILISTYLSKKIWVLVINFQRWRHTHSVHINVKSNPIKNSALLGMFFINSAQFVVLTRVMRSDGR